MIPQKSTHFSQRKGRMDAVKGLSKQDCYPILVFTFVPTSRCHCTSVREHFPIIPLIKPSHPGVRSRGVAEERLWYDCIPAASRPAQTGLDWLLLHLGRVKTADIIPQEAGNSYCKVRLGPEKYALIQTGRRGGVSRCRSWLSKEKKKLLPLLCASHTIKCWICIWKSSKNDGHKI